MKKYRGKHQGKIRGPYKRRDFRLDGEEVEVSLSGSEIRKYLTAEGHCVTVGHSDSDENVDYSLTTSAYHFGGASIGVEERRFEKGCGVSNLVLILISNNGLNDILQKFSSDIPWFKDLKEIDPRS